MLVDDKIVARGTCTGIDSQMLQHDVASSFLDLNALWMPRQDQYEQNTIRAFPPSQALTKFCFCLSASRTMWT